MLKRFIFYLIPEPKNNVLFFAVGISTACLFCQGYSEELSKIQGNLTLLYWKAHEVGLSFAVSRDGVSQMASQIKVENPEFEWDVGFKIGLGCFLHPDRWNLQLQFTSFQTHTDEEKKGFPIWQTSLARASTFAQEITMHWRLHLGLVDLTLSKPYPLSRTFLLTPQVGIRAGSLRQKYSIENGEKKISNRAEQRIHMKNKYFGIGPNLGLLGQWSWGEGWRVCGQSVFCLTFGEFYRHQDEYAGKEKLLGVYDIFPISVPMLDLNLGICWEHRFHQFFKDLKLELSWNELLFFSQNQLLHFTNREAQGVFFANQGDLFVSGIAFNVSLTF